MSRIWNCVDCGIVVGRRVKRCPQCNRLFLKNRGPTYVRTSEHNAKLSQSLKGKSHNWRSGGSLPGVAEKIRQWWTSERREAARQRGLMMAENRSWRDRIAAELMGESNPNYQGKDNATGYGPGWGRLHRDLVRQRAQGKCEVCGREARFDIHHKDFGKDNHDPENLAVLCRSCHKRTHYAQHT